MLGPNSAQDVGGVNLKFRGNVDGSLMAKGATSPIKERFVGSLISGERDFMAILSLLGS